MKKSRGWLSPSTVLERSQAANSLLPPACHASPSKLLLKEGGDLQYQERCQKSLKPTTTLKGFVMPSYSPSWESLSSWPKWLQSSSLLLFQPFRLPEDICPWWYPLSSHFLTLPGELKLLPGWGGQLSLDMCWILDNRYSESILTSFERVFLKWRSWKAKNYISPMLLLLYIWTWIQLDFLTGDLKAEVRSIFLQLCSVHIGKEVLVDMGFFFKRFCVSHLESRCLLDSKVTATLSVFWLS